jgi:beta-lactamase regulating signal transducer with metallopeptidase domain/polyhydroxyalkanoate synthesis regulator phasin
MMEQAIIEYAINALWQVPLLAGSAWLLLRMVRPAPVTQHRVWLTVLGLAVLLPVHGMGSGGVSATRHAGSVIEASRDEALVLPAQNDLPRTPRQRFAFASLFSARTGSVRLTTRTVHWLLRLYVATIVIGLIRIARAWLAARTLVENSQEICLSDRDRMALEDLSQRLGIRPPQLRQTGEVSSPMVVGGRAPVLLLPEGFARHTENEIKAALCHELAHIQRRDYLVNVVCQVAALPLAWHPVVDWVQQRIRMTREMVCDAMAAQEMKSHLGYAKCLLALAHSMLGERRMPAQAQFLGLFGNHTLEERVMRLMDTTTMSLRAKTARVVSGAAMMIASGVIAGMFHLTPTMAQAGVLPQATQNPPEVAQAAMPEPKPSSPATATPGDAKPATPKKRSNVHRNGSDGDRREPTLTEQPLIDKDVQQRMDDLAKQMAEETAKFNSPEFKERMGDLARQMADATAKFNSPEFKQRMDDLQKQMAEETAKLNTPEFRQRMEDAQQQMSDATTKFNSPEFKQRMDDLARQMAEQTAKLNTPEFKQRMEDAQQQMADATAKYDSPEFKQRMNDLARQMAEQTAKFNGPEFKKRMDDLQKQMQQQMEEFSRKYQRSPNP